MIYCKCYRYICCIWRVLIMSMFRNLLFTKVFTSQISLIPQNIDLNTEANTKTLTIVSNDKWSLAFKSNEEE